MSHDEQIEVTAIYSAAGLSPPEGLVTRRPFRAPHHTVSTGALIGGGTIPRPGEISLAHRGVLFLDELAEFQRVALEALRQPLEDRAVSIARVGGNVRLPASFHLIASSNPCPCGWHGSEERTCTCTIGSLERYRTRLSGPILDRIDIQVRVGGVSLEELRGDRAGESSETVRARVEAARDRQARRLATWGVRLNAELGPDATRGACRLTGDGERTLARLFARRAPMSARGLDRLLRTARTIADLDGRDDVGGEEIREAAMYRALDLPSAADPRVLRAGVTAPDQSSRQSSGRPDSELAK
jgi:magnesium chelatase family protein